MPLFNILFRLKWYKLGNWWLWCKFEGSEFWKKNSWIPLPSKIKKLGFSSWLDYMCRLWRWWTVWNLQRIICDKGFRINLGLFKSLCFWFFLGLHDLICKIKWTLTLRNKNFHNSWSWSERSLKNKRKMEINCTSLLFRWFFKDRKKSSW